MAKKAKIYLFLIVSALMISNSEVFATQNYLPVSHACVKKASSYYNVPYWLIVAVMKSEGGKVGMKSKNTNATYDIGPMQINSIWLPKIRKHGISEKDIVYNGCTNVSVGAWILSNQLKKYPFWKAVGAYHSKTPSLNKKYRRRVYNIAKSITDVHEIYDYANNK